MYCPICNSNDKSTVLEYTKYPIYIKPIQKEALDLVPLRPLTIIVCNYCGHVYQDISISSSELSEIYEVVYESYHSPALSGIGSSLAHEFLQFLEQNITHNPKSVLEIGCYDGYLLNILRERYACRVMGCDPSYGAEIAQKLNVEVIRNYYSSKMFSQTFDYVVLRGVVEHIQNPVPFLQDVGRVLEKDGVVAVEVPHVAYSLKNAVIGDFFHEHISYFTPESLSYCLIRSGFAPIVADNSSYYIRIIATKTRIADDIEFRSDSAKNIPKLKQLFKEYNALINAKAEGLRSTLRSCHGKTTYIYGGGGHTLGLLSRTHDFLKPAGVIDGDPQKEGKYIPGFNVPVYSRAILDHINCKNTVIIVSSKIFQKEITKGLYEYISKGLQVITLYPVVECISKNKGE